MTNLELAFFLTFFLSIYSYTVYPALLHVLSVILRNPWERGDYTPSVTIVISAYNEEKDIEDKIRNSLLLDYPEDKLEIVVSSDGSTDRTDEIVAGIFFNGKVDFSLLPNCHRPVVSRGLQHKKYQQ